MRLGSPNKANWRRLVPITPSSGAGAPRQSDAFTIRNDLVGRLPYSPASPGRRIRHHHQCLRSPMTSSDAARAKFFEHLHALLAAVLNADKTPPHPDQHLAPAGSREDHLDASLVRALTHARLCPHLEARPSGHAGEKDDPDADGLTDDRLVIPKMRIRSQPRKRPQVPAANENASVGKQWCQLRDTVQSTTPSVLGHVCYPNQDWFDDNDAAIIKLFAKKNSLHKAYVIRSTDVNKAVFCRSRCLVQQRVCEMQDAWTARKAEEIQKWKNFFLAIKAVYGPTAKGTASVPCVNETTLIAEETQILR
nr:unnamed protein product [Spirometra erinaceieuropaei]